MEDLKSIINEIIKKHHEDGFQGISHAHISKFLESFHELLQPALSDAVFAHYKHAIEFLESQNGVGQRPILYTIGNIPSRKKALVKYLYGGYTIATDMRLNTKERRIQIGHELGHILINNLNNTIYRSESLSGFPDKQSRELMANLINYSMHIEQSDFYMNTSKQYQYNKEEREELLSEIFNLKERSNHTPHK
ncbi:MAG: hypothetical protein B0D92_07570 [Spirochaeta sp. LUC14_002_19_P3]|nr:MAG: hypothetical protein B0D92_07570 [Spirochaeta sp. LUC14_002_19_P3]